MRETKTLSLGQAAFSYEVTQLGALVGRKVLLRAGRLVGAAIVSQGADVEAFLRLILDGISDEDLDFVSNAFAGSTKIVQTLQDGQGSKIKLPLQENFDEHFANRYGDMIRWLVFCFKFNFESFLAEVGDLLPRAPEPKTSSGSPNT